MFLLIEEVIPRSSRNGCDLISYNNVASWGDSNYDQISRGRDKFAHCVCMFQAHLPVFQYKKKMFIYKNILHGVMI